METKKDNTQKVKGILEKSIDAEKGFKTAFENSKDKSLKNYFFEKSKQRKSFIHEVKMELSKNTEAKIEPSGSINGDFHRTWMGLKSLLVSNNDEAILEESIMSEKAELEEFENILDKEYLTLEIRNILSKQHSILKKDFETMKSMKTIQNQF